MGLYVWAILGYGLYVQHTYNVPTGIENSPWWTWWIYNTNWGWNMLAVYFIVCNFKLCFIFSHSTAPSVLQFKVLEKTLEQRSIQFKVVKEGQAGLRLMSGLLFNFLSQVQSLLL